MMFHSRRFDPQRPIAASLQRYAGRTTARPACGKGAAKPPLQSKPFCGEMHADGYAVSDRGPAVATLPSAAAVGRGEAPNIAWSICTIQTKTRSTVQRRFDELIPTREEDARDRVFSRFYVEDGVVMMTASILVQQHRSGARRSLTPFLLRSPPRTRIRHAALYRHDGAFNSSHTARRSRTAAAHIRSSGVFASHAGGLHRPLG